MAISAPGSNERRSEARRTVEGEAGHRRNKLRAGCVRTVRNDDDGSSNGHRKDGYRCDKWKLQRAFACHSLRCSPVGVDVGSALLREQAATCGV